MLTKFALVEEVKITVGQEESTSKKEEYGIRGTGMQNTAYRLYISPKMPPYNYGHAHPGSVSRWWRYNDYISVAILGLVKELKVG